MVRRPPSTTGTDTFFPEATLFRSLRVMGAVVPALDLDLRGPSVAAEAADQTRRAPHMDVRCFPRGQDAPSENPAGSANPMRSTGREGGVCFLCARFLCTSRERDRKSVV